MMIELLRSAGTVDAVYLDLHGAMVAEHIDDADGELLRRTAPWSARISRSSQASISTPTYRRRWRVSQARCVSFRTYPHVDMADSGARAARCLHDLIGRPRPAHALEQLDFLMPLTSQSTLVDPMRALMAEAIALERAPLVGSG